MLLVELLNVEYEDAVIAGRLFRYIEAADPMLEATARILRFDYERAKNDPRPRVLVLGRWRHGRTGNKLIAGINLNYLNDEELSRLNHNMARIMSPKRLKNRWWTGYSLLPGIWLKAYRQYDERFVHSMNTADLSPEPKDYETPKDPGDQQDAEVSPEKAAKLHKAKEIEKRKEGESPHEPKKKRSLLRLGKDTLKKIAKFVKDKLGRNRRSAQAKEKTDSLRAMDDEGKAEAEREADEIKRLEYEKKIHKAKLAQKKNRKGTERAAREVDDLRNVEDEYRHDESISKRVDMLAEANIRPKRLTWKSPQNYTYWHNPARFTQYESALRGSVLDYSHGTKLILVYNIPEDKIIIDLAEHPSELLAEAAWKWHDTIQVTVDDSGINIEPGDVVNNRIAETLQKHPVWGIIQEVSETDFQK